MAKNTEQQNILPDLEQAENRLIDSLALALATIARDLYTRERAEKKGSNLNKGG